MVNYKIRVSKFEYKYYPGIIMVSRIGQSISILYYKRRVLRTPSGLSLQPDASKLTGISKARGKKTKRMLRTTKKERVLRTTYSEAT